MISVMESDRWDWSTLTCQSLPGERIPGYLERLLDRDEGERKRAYGVLHCEVANQGQLYSAAAACVDVLVAWLEGRGRLPAEAVSLMEAILNARSPGHSVMVGEAATDVAQYVRQRVLDGVPLLVSCAENEDLDWFREFCFLVPQLADSSQEVIDYLRRSAPLLQGEKRALCYEALEEAEEVLRDGHMP
ncbi:hypothetical protein [Streptomyces sp. NPDC058307]|uniref:hypothetical protein n=1 Tax=Streptomyces sp. NPDC058307 TaxID=3346439 RepID=UPI0036EDC16A